MNDLDSFLTGQQTGMFDSSGEFTIAADKALEKLAHSQLPDPSYWVLKVAQFATVYGVEAMDLTIGLRVWRCDAEIPCPISLTQIQRGLGSVKELDDRALDHLVTGLRALGGIAGRRFVLRLTDREASEYLFWDGEKLSSRRDEVSAPLTAFSLEVTASTPGAWGTFVDVLGLEQRAAEAAVLTQKAFTVPYRLTVDGRRLGYSEMEPSRWFSQPLLWDVARYEGGMRMPGFLSIESEESPRISAFWQISYNYTLEHKILRTSPEPVDYGIKSSLHWLRDGVLVRTETLKGAVQPFSLELFVDATDCPADLGGLNLRKTGTFAEKRAWIRDLLSHISERGTEKIRVLKSLRGRVLGGWDSLVAGTSHLPLSGSVPYYRAEGVGKTLNALPGFRKKLLRRVQKQTLGFHALQLP